MPFPILAPPAFADVPFGPGIPPMLRPPGFIAGFDVGDAMTEDASGIGDYSQPQWGVFSDDGELLLDPDTIFSVDVRKESRKAIYPLEGGSFQDYNKVHVPFDVRVRMIVSRTANERSQFLADVDALYNGLDLVSVVTPEVTYDSVNVTHYDYHREARNGGVSMLTVDIWLEEVRASSPSTTTTNLGNLSTQEPTFAKISPPQPSDFSFNKPQPTFADIAPPSDTELQSAVGQPGPDLPAANVS